MAKPDRPTSDGCDRLSIADYAALPLDDGWRDELVRGRLVREPRPGAEHARLQFDLARRIGAHIERHRLGTGFTDVGIILAASPATIRGPDVAFVSRDRLPRGPDAGFLRVAPDLVIEILSPSNRAEEVEAKVREYLDAGVRLVWIVDPITRTVTTARTPHERRSYGVEDELDGGEVLPSFRLSVSELWPQP
jgi:Uma2 family endonuclease